MAQQTTLRELIARIGFEVDDTKLLQFDKRMSGVKSSIGSFANDLKYLTLASGGVGAGIGFIINQAGKMEQAKVSFEVLTGSAENAKKVMGELTEFARVTPFTIPQVLDNAKILMGYGIEMEKIIPTMKALGDIAAVSGGENFPQLALAFGQIKAKGHLAGQEMLQLTNAFVGRNDLGKAMGIKPEEFDDMMAAGKISFKMVEDAFLKMTGEGGRFNNMMIRQSKTLLGMLSNVKDFLLLQATAIGDSLLPQAKQLVEAFLKWAEVNKEIIKKNALIIFKELIKFLKIMGFTLYAVVRIFQMFSDIVGGTSRAIKILSTVAMAFIALRLASGIGSIIISFYGLATSATVANVAMAAMPVIIASAVALVILILEDLKSYVEGKDSVFGRLMEGFPLLANSIKLASAPLIYFLKLLQGVVDLTERWQNFIDKKREVIKGPFLSGHLGFDPEFGSNLNRPNSLNTDWMPNSPLGSNGSQTNVYNIDVNSPVNMGNGTGYSDGISIRNGITDGLDTILRNVGSANKNRVEF